MTAEPHKPRMEGRAVHLSGGRIVWLANEPKSPHRHVLIFRNSDGDDTAITLSHEAFQAALMLMLDETKGEPCRFPHKEPELAWKVVRETEDV